MKYYEELIDKKVFDYNDIVGITGNKGTANNLIYRYKEKGYIKSIKRNLYTVISLETKQSVANKFEIGSNITDSSYISHHSAFSYYGITNQVFYEIYVSSNTRFNDFVYDAITYKFIQSKCEKGIIKPVENPLIRITDIERTVVDSIKDFEKIGGLEELLQCIDLITYLDYEKLYKYLQLYNSQIVYQKTGYILEHFKDELKIPGKFFDMCESKIGKSRRYLYKNLKNEKGIYNGKWQLIVPKNLLSIIRQGDDILYQEDTSVF